MGLVIGGAFSGGGQVRVRFATNRGAFGFGQPPAVRVFVLRQAPIPEELGARRAVLLRGAAGAEPVVRHEERVEVIGAVGRQGGRVHGTIVEGGTLFRKPPKHPAKWALSRPLRKRTSQAILRT